MNTQEIEYILKHDSYIGPTFHGVYAIDKLPYFKTGTCVINTSPSTEKTGHWVAMFITDTTAEYFDSYGREPLTKLKRRWRNKSWITNPVPLQSPLSAVCGHYCIYFLMHKARGFSMDSIVMDFVSDVDYNDEMVHEFIESRYDLNTKLIDTEGVIIQLARASIYAPSIRNN